MNLLLSFALIATISSSHAQIESTVVKIDAQPNKTTTYTGNLSSGELMENLRWASTSSNACFPGTQNTKFQGNHVLHYFQIPAYSEVEIKLIPKDKKANFSLYGYQVGTQNFNTPPDLPSCVSCEADYKWDYKWKGKTQDHTRSIKFNSTTNEYNIFIGVAGADDLVMGEYTIEINLVSKIENTEAQEALKIFSVEVTKGKVVSVDGDLKEGRKIHDLSWASSSSNACFPGTQNTKFQGNHVMYVTEIPRHSNMEITVVPNNDKANFSIYAYQDGTASTAYPPNLNSCVSCEADHKWDYKWKGKTQDHTRTVKLNAINNPYRVVIGVVGAEGLEEGGYTLKISLTER